MRAVEGWKTKTLRDLAVINYGKSPADILAPDGSYPVVGTGGAERLGNDYLYEGDSIILGRKGTIDRVYFATGRFWTIDTAYYLSNFAESVPLWLFYFLQTIDLRQMNEATGVPSLSRDVLYKIEIPMPPKSEQTKIAEILSTVDRAIEQTEASIAKEQRIKTGLMQDLLTRGIDEHGNLRSEQTHQFKDSPLGRIPVEWEVGEFGIYARLQGGFAFSSRHSREFGVRWLKIANVGLNKVRWEVEDFLPNEHLSKFSEFSLSEGNIVIALTRPVIRGELKIAKLDKGDVPSLLNQRVARVIPHQAVDEEFVLSLMKSRFYVAQVEEAILGTDPPNISTGQIEGIVVPVVGQEEQSRIGVFIKHRRQIQQKYSKQYSKALRLKIALMQELLTGKKRVSPLFEAEGLVS